MEDIKENQAELLKMKITMSKMKNTLDRINGRLDIAEERISELEDIAIEIIQNESQRGKKVIEKRMNRASVSCGIILSNLIYT